MKCVNQLVRLDLTFALMGIPGAQVVAAALRLKSYASLTDVNLTGNRMKAMGARAIIAALRTNQCVTSINLSHNEIRNDFVDDLAETLMQNNVLTTVDLSDNPIFADTARQTSMPTCLVETLVQAIVQNQWLINLGILSRYDRLNNPSSRNITISLHLNSLCASDQEVRLLQSVLDKNQLLVDDLLLSTAYKAAKMESNDGSGLTKWGGPGIMTFLEPMAVPLFVQVWEHTTRKEARFSLLWRLLLKPAVKQRCGQILVRANYTVHWQIVIHRKCDVHGMLEDQAANGDVNIQTGNRYLILRSMNECSKITLSARTNFFAQQINHAPSALLWFIVTKAMWFLSAYIMKWTPMIEIKILSNLLSKICS